VSDALVELLEELPFETVTRIFDALPVDITFVDAEDTVIYFNSPPEGRLFPRTKMDLGRTVQKCHPPKSVHLVSKILDEFKAGTRESADFWINFQGRFVLIRYFPVKGKDGTYLGTLEVTQDITDVQKLKGEKRLLDADVTKGDRTLKVD